MKIRFVRSGARKVGGRKGDALLRIVPALREILASGKHLGSEADRRGRGNIAAVHAFGAAVNLDGRIRDLVAKVFEPADGNFH